MLEAGRPALRERYVVAHRWLESERLLLVACRLSELCLVERQPHHSVVFGWLVVYVHVCRHFCLGILRPNRIEYELFWLSYSVGDLCIVVESV